MIGSRLKNLRLNSCLSQKVLAKKLQLSSARYSNYENNRREPDLTLLIEIAHFFSVSVDFLLGLELENLNLTLREKDLLNKFHALNFSAQEKLNNYADDLIANPVNLAQNEPQKKQA